MSRYSQEIKIKIVAAYREGESVNSLSHKYGISRYSIQSWCGLRKEVELRHATPLPQGRPKINSQKQEQIIKRLQMENELLRNFLSVVGRR